MAKKPRTPDPPRKVQAPKVRQKAGAPGRGPSMPGTNTLIGVGLVIVAAIVVGWFGFFSGSGGSKANVTRADLRKVSTAMAAAGCTFRSLPAGASQEHMSSPNQHVSYRTYPAASGVHYPVPGILGNYRSAADPRYVVHDLEHGAIAVWYGPSISAQDRGALDAFYDESPDALVVTPLEEGFSGVTYPKHKPLGGKIAMTAWTINTDTRLGTVHIAVCPHYDEAAFTAFRDVFRGKGPERFPVSSMKPGS
jgi:Protein of unknown function (DUF3105)